MQQVLYFYEGESEEKLITYLKDRQIIKPGKLKLVPLDQSLLKLQFLNFPVRLALMNLLVNSSLLEASNAVNT
jgi:hypothetical protein